MEPVDTTRFIVLVFCVAYVCAGLMWYGAHTLRKQDGHLQLGWASLLIGLALTTVAFIYVATKVDMSLHLGMSRPFLMVMILPLVALLKEGWLSFKSTYWGKFIGCLMFMAAIMEIMGAIMIDW